MGSQQRVASPPAATSHCISRDIYSAQTTEGGRRPRGPCPVPRSPSFNRRWDSSQEVLTQGPQAHRSPPAPCSQEALKQSPGGWPALSLCPQQAKQEPCPHALEGPRAASCQSLMFSGWSKRWLAVSKPGPGPSLQKGQARGEPFFSRDPLSGRIGRGCAGPASQAHWAGCSAGLR